MREPFMLSDTVMVLLRQQYDLAEYLTEFLKGTTPFSEDQATKYSEWVETHRSAARLREIQDELLEELRILWLFSDHVPTHSLDWNMVLTEELMQLAEKAFTVSMHQHDYVHYFLGRLQVVYREMYKVRAETTP